MLDLSADNRDGFEDTDGQLYTSNSFYFRVKNMFYYEEKELKHQKLNIRNSIKNYEEDRMI